MFSYRRDPGADHGVGVAFTSAALDLSDRQDAGGRRAAFRRLADELGVPVAVARQVHGTEVLEVTGPAASGLVDRTEEADALVTTATGLAVAVRVADCVPVLLADGDATVVAAVHAGRVGLLGGVIGRAVASVRRHSSAPLRAWVGPHVCASCYEVPPDLAADAAARLGTEVPTTRWGTTGIDLGGAALVQLRAEGVAVTEVEGCTLEEATLHSHRRDAERAGRMVGAIWIA